jgi:hypothetical protein
VRQALAAELEPEVLYVELGSVVPIPRWPTISWRQESTEAVVRAQRSRNELTAPPAVAAV